MSWGSWSNFFAMGGYALYVWGSFAAVFGLIACEVALLILRRRNILNQLALMAKSRTNRNRGQHETTS
jgi:heme exporter protein D